MKFFHRTLPDYLDAFLDAGLYVTKIVDVDHPNTAARRANGEDLPGGEQFTPPIDARWSCGCGASAWRRCWGNMPGC